MSFLTARFSSPVTLTLTLLSLFLYFNTIISMPPNHQNTIIPIGNPHVTNVTYHFGPVLSSDITVHIIWYGAWPRAHKNIIRDFISSISGSKHRSPSVSGWWKTAQLYTDQTGSNVTGTVCLGSEYNDRFMSHGKNLTFLSIPSIIKAAIYSKTHPLRVDPKGGVYLVLTAPNVHMDHFCHETCGYHYFTFPSTVGYTLPYVWVGNSATQCPDMCTFPFAARANTPEVKPFKPPNGDVGTDGMVSIIGRELAETATNPLFNGWNDGVFVEIGNACLERYGPDNGIGLCIGRVMRGDDGARYNMYGVRRRFLVQWIWDYVGNCCAGPNGKCGW